MAKYTEGIQGGIRGTIGKVVGAKWKGVDYLRTRRRDTKDSPTLLQEEHRAKFTMVSKFVHSISNLLMACYPGTKDQTGINSAFKWIYDNALTGLYPAIDLDYSKILISRGELHNAFSPAVNVVDGIINFNWTDNTDNLLAKADDRSVLLVHCPELQQSIYKLTGAQRSAEKDSLNAFNWKGKYVETWLSFLSADGKLAASSIYTGRLMVQ